MHAANGTAALRVMLTALALGGCSLVARFEEFGPEDGADAGVDAPGDLDAPADLDAGPIDAPTPFDAFLPADAPGTLDAHEHLDADAATDPAVCTPATAGCAGPTVRRVCRPDGSGFEDTPCAAGESCDAGDCAFRCGDGLIGGLEACDDRNTTPGDGCDASCREESCASLSLPSGAGAYAEVADASALRLIGTSFTVEMWANVESFPATAGCHHVLAAKHTGGTGGWYLAVIRAGCGRPGGTVVFAVWTGSTNPAVFSTSVVSTGRWFHVAATYDVATRLSNLWLDGRNAGTVTLASPASATGAMRLGGDSDASTSSPFEGRIDEVRISNVVRYTTTFTPTNVLSADPYTIGLWRFEEGAGMTGADASGSAGDAILRVGATWARFPGCTR
jgi:cysteine-rich repeat protein